MSLSWDFPLGDSNPIIVELVASLYEICKAIQITQQFIDYNVESTIYIIMKILWDYFIQNTFIFCIPHLHQL